MIISNILTHITSTEPTNWENPLAIAGFIVYFAMYLLILRLSFAAALGPIDPLCDFILCAVCQVLLITWQKEI